MYGEVLQIKYFEDSFGVAYFLSLHQRYFLIFIIETSKSGVLQVSLLKSISIPENEFTGNILEIVVTGSDKIYLRDDSNAYQISVDIEADNYVLLDHCISLKISTFEYIMAILGRQNISDSNFDSFSEVCLYAEHVPIIGSTFSFINGYQNTMDIFASRFLFLASMRHKIQKENSNFNFLSELMEYEILSASRSDSQVANCLFFKFDHVLPILEYIDRGVYGDMRRETVIYRIQTFQVLILDQES